MVGARLRLVFVGWPVLEGGCCRGADGWRRRPDGPAPTPSWTDRRPADRYASVGSLGAVSDIEVAHKTGVPAIGYAKTPQRGAELDEAGADGITADIRGLISLRTYAPPRVDATAVFRVH